MSIRSNEYSTPLQDSRSSRINFTVPSSESQDGPEASGDQKDDEIARLKRAFHEAVEENKNKKDSAKTNT